MLSLLVLCFICSVSLVFSGSRYFLQVTDPHSEPEYLPGSDIKMACVNGTGSAGICGDHRCDTPNFVLRSTIKAIADNYALSFVLFTGDASPHYYSYTYFRDSSEAIVLDNLQTVLDIISSATDNDVQIIPQFGNHDCYPEEILAPDADGQKYLAKLGNIFSDHLSPDAMTTFLHGGYYLEYTQTGLAVLAINTLWCSFENPYATLDGGAMDLGMWDWVDATLTTLEAAGTPVIVVGHHPPGYRDYVSVEDFLPACNERLETILAAHPGVVNTFIAGHTHRDQFITLRDPEDRSKPIATGYVAPAASGYTTQNPGLRVFEYDEVTGEILDFHQWYWDIDLSNMLGQPTIQLEYTAKGQYGLQDLSPASWDALGAMLEVDGAADPQGPLFNTFYRNLHSQYSRYDTCSPEDAILAVCCTRDADQDGYRACMQRMGSQQV